MTQLINLQAVPNQTLSATLDGIRFELVIRDTGGVMAVDITREGQLIIRGQRLAAGTPLIPYRYLENGNFILATTGGEIPFYTRFGVTQTLLFASSSELVGFRSG